MSKERIERIEEMEKCLDDAGKLPKDLKRGVLSEDAVFDLITEHERLIERLEEASAYEPAGEYTV